MDYTCGTCLKVFPTGREARDAHTAATGHKPPRHECCACPLVSATAGAAAAHQAEANHFPHPCRDPACGETWPTETGRDKHELEAHRFCGPCGRRCDTDANLRMHLNSSAHRPANLACPQCGGGFASATGLAHHLERACGQLGRQAVLGVVAPRDPNGWFSSDAVRFVRAPREAADTAWNGTAWRCPQVGCGSEHASQTELSAHLASPDHDEPVFVCYSGCGRQFLALSAIFNHLESDGCAGEGSRKKKAPSRRASGVPTASVDAGRRASGVPTTPGDAGRRASGVPAAVVEASGRALRDVDAANRDTANRRVSRVHGPKDKDKSTPGPKDKGAPGQKERSTPAPKDSRTPARRDKGGRDRPAGDKPAGDKPAPTPAAATRDTTAPRDTPTRRPKAPRAKPRPNSIRGLPA
ncbi:hypothetical protein Q8F55_007546 [Vanrija albida]|uniref:C2H2-type domain-containing protein n=1 Tax=Vanrija albida TaxID=181172 RepID=A0ABR3PTU5_9TREE